MTKPIFRGLYQALVDTLHIWAREMRTVFTDQAVLLFLIIVPLVYPLLYSWIYNNEVVHNVPIALVDQDGTATSRAFTQRLNASADVEVEATPQNVDDARDLVGRQRVRGVVVLPNGFERSLARGEQAIIPVFCDMSVMLNYKAIYQATLSVSMDMGTELQKERSRSFTQRDEELSTAPLIVEAQPIFNTTQGYGNAILPAVLMLILQQTLLLGVGLAAGTARERGRYRELMPISERRGGIMRILLGKGSCYAMVHLVMGTYLGLVVPHLFHFTEMNEALSFFPFITVYVLASTFFSMACSAMVHHRENVMLLVVFTSVPLLFLSGVSWPQSNIPTFWQWVAYIFPSTFGQRAYLRLSSMGASLDDVRTEYIALCTQIVVYMLLTAMALRHQMQRVRTQEETKK